MLIVCKNQLFTQDYQVVKYSKQGEYLGVVAGMGHNRGTWDSAAKSKRTAQQWARICRQDDSDNTYRVETVN